MRRMGPWADTIPKPCVLSDDAALNVPNCVSAVPITDAFSGRMSACVCSQIGVEQFRQQLLMLSGALRAAAEESVLAAPKAGVGVWILGSQAGSMSGSATKC